MKREKERNMVVIGFFALSKYYSGELKIRKKIKEKSMFEKSCQFRHQKKKKKKKKNARHTRPV